MELDVKEVMVAQGSLHVPPTEWGEKFGKPPINAICIRAKECTISAENKEGQIPPPKREYNPQTFLLHDENGFSNPIIMMSLLISGNTNGAKAE